MKADRGILWINLGLLLLAAALFLTIRNMGDSRRAGQTSRQVIIQLCEAAETTTEALTESQPDTDREMPVRTIDGRDYIGVLSIPSLELELPVLSQWDYPGLKVAPCRYSGSLYRDDLILCAHNYVTHFGRLKDLRVGDTVLFTDMDDHTTAYQMVEREMLAPTDVEGMAAGDWDLTLYTCTVGGKSRVTVRFARQTND